MSRLKFQEKLDAGVMLILQALQIAAVCVLVVTALMGFGMIISSLASFCPEVTFVGLPINEQSGHGDIHGHQTSTGQSGGHSWLGEISAEYHLGRRGAKALQLSFAGLEFLLLSPLSYLILRSLADYVNHLWFHRLPNKAKEAVLEEVSVADGKEGLLDTKVLIVGLLFGIVSTHLVSELLNHSPSHPFGIKENAAGFVLLAILLIAYLRIENAASKTSARPT